MVDSMIDMRHECIYKEPWLRRVRTLSTYIQSLQYLLKYSYRLLSACSEHLSIRFSKHSDGLFHPCASAQTDRAASIRVQSLAVVRSAVCTCLRCSRLPTAAQNPFRQA